MEIIQIKCYEFSNHLVNSMHAPQNIEIERKRHPVDRSI